MRRNGNEVVAIVTEALPNTMFRLRLDDGKEVIGYLAGRMRVNKINLMVGDRVTVILDRYGGKTTNRITYRL